MAAGDDDDGEEDNYNNNATSNNKQSNNKDDNKKIEIHMIIKTNRTNQNQKIVEIITVIIEINVTMYVRMRGR